MTKTKKKKAPNSQARLITELRRIARNFVYWRYHRDDDPSEVVTHKMLMGVNPRRIPLKNIEYEMQHLSLRYQCVTVSYFKSPHNNTIHRSFGYAQTTDPIKIAEVDIKPIISAAKMVAEKDTNNRLLYARAMVLFPYTRKSSDIMSVLKRLKVELGLTQDDYDQLSSLLDEHVEVYEFDETPNLDLDEQIQQYL